MVYNTHGRPEPVLGCDVLCAHVSCLLAPVRRSLRFSPSLICHYVSILNYSIPGWFPPIDEIDAFPGWRNVSSASVFISAVG